MTNHATPALLGLAFLALSGCFLTGGEAEDKIDDIPDEDSSDISIGNISPESGPVRGGTTVSIEADSLDDEPLVYFGGRQADVTDWGSNGVICITPQFAGEGWVDVEIWSGADYGVAEDGFYVGN